MRRDQNISRRYILRYYAAGIASIGFGLGCILVNMSWQDRDTVKNKNIGTMEAMYGVGIASAWFGLACIVKISRTIEGYLKFTLELKQAAIEYNQVCHQVAIDVKNVIGNINQSVENANSAMLINQILAPTLFLRRIIKFPPRITEEWNALLQETVSADFYSLSEKDSRSPKKIREAARFLEEYRHKVTGLGVTVLEDIEEFIHTLTAREDEKLGKGAVVQSSCLLEKSLVSRGDACARREVKDEEIERELLFKEAI